MNPIKTLTTILLFVLLLLSSVFTKAMPPEECDLYFSSVSDLTWDGYNPYDTLEGAVQNSTIIVGNNTNSGGGRPTFCDFHITTSAGQRQSADWARGAFNNGYMVEYLLLSKDIVNSAYYLKDHIDATLATQTLSGSTKGNDLGRVKARMRVPALQSFVPSGIYTDTVILSLWLGDPLDFSNLQEETSFNITIPVNPSLSINFGDTSGGPSYTLDFDVLEQGESSNVDMWISATSTYSVSIYSANNGVLKHTSNPNASDIDYLFNYNGDVIPLNNGMVVLETDEEPSLSKHYIFNIAVGAIDGSESVGSYNDRIIIDLTEL